MNDTGLAAVHICKSCGAAIERDQISPEALISGVIRCPKCGHESALNLEIIEPSAKRPPSRDTPPTT
jgi:DNA-directed RNA polymerase subunit RPC12/RpoP